MAAVTQRGSPDRQVRAGDTLSPAAADLYRDLRIPSLLRQLLVHSNRLLGVVAGSVSLVDAARGRYEKAAEQGAACALGGTFPLHEGVTGQVVSLRRPVVLASYRDVPTGHLPLGHPAGSGAVAAVPIWWRGDVIGANVAFAGRSRRFTSREVDELELLTQLAAAGIARAGTTGPRPAPSGDLRGRQAHTPGPPSPLTPRERDTLALLARGMTDREVARALAISPKTAEKHVGALLRKTATTSRTAAVMHCLRQGWLSHGESSP